MHINYEAQRGLLRSRGYSSGYLARGRRLQDLAAAGLSMGCGAASGLFGAPGGFCPDACRGLVPPACIFTASSSLCSGRDKEGKGSVSPSLLAVRIYRKKGYNASVAQCLVCSLLPGGRGDAGVASP